MQNAHLHFHSGKLTKNFFFIIPREAFHVHVLLTATAHYIYQSPYLADKLVPRMNASFYLYLLMNTIYIAIINRSVHLIRIIAPLSKRFFLQKACADFDKLKM